MRLKTDLFDGVYIVSVFLCILMKKVTNLSEMCGIIYSSPVKHAHCLPEYLKRETWCFRCTLSGGSDR